MICKWVFNDSRSHLYSWTDFFSNIIQVDYIKKEKKLHFSRGDYSKNTKKKNDDVSLAAND